MFADRIDTAEPLAEALRQHRDRNAPVLAIPRGAVPMSAVRARRLHAELDVVMVRTLRLPGAPEYAVGAVDEIGWPYVAPHAGMAGATPCTGSRDGADLMKRIRSVQASSHA